MKIIDEPRVRRVALVADHVDLAGTTLGIHHAGADHYGWPLLSERGTLDIDSLVDVLEQQHEAIHKGFAQVTQAVAFWRKGTSTHERDTFVSTLD